jgi:hypothetical protein
MDEGCPEIAPAKGNMNASARTCLNWRTIALSRNGVILQKIAVPDAYVVPQNFTGNHGLASR